MEDAQQPRRQAATRQSIIVRLLFPVGLLKSTLSALGFLLLFFPAASESASLTPGCFQNLIDIKSRCFDYVYDVWRSGLLLSLRLPSPLNLLQVDAPVVSWRNLLLLGNVVVFIILSCLHLRLVAASRDLKTRKKRKALGIQGSEEQVFDLDIGYCGQEYLMHSIPPLIIDTNDIYEREVADATGFVSAQIADVSTVTHSSVSLKQSPEYATAKPDAAAIDYENGIDGLDLSISKRNVDSDTRLLSTASPDASAQLQSAASLAEDDDQIAFLTGDQPVREPDVLAEKTTLQKDGASGFSKQGKLVDAAAMADTAPCHKQLHVNGMKTSASHTGPSSAASRPHPISVSKSTSFQVRNSPIDPDLLQSNNRGKSMDADYEPSNLDGGQQPVNGRRGKRRDNGKSAVKNRSFRLRREPSITSQEELNARVENFISRFNQNIQIQRQQSSLSFIQMVSRGS